MPFTWEEISKEWLLGAEVEYTPKECVNAFNAVEELMDREWLRKEYAGSRGVAVAGHVIEFGRTILRLRGIPGSECLYERFRADKDRKGGATIFMQRPLDIERLSAISEAQSALHYLDLGLPVELYPEVIIGSRITHPDFRVLADGTWVYVEVTSPQFSDELLDLCHHMQEIGQAIGNLGIELEARVELDRAPTSHEINEISTYVAKLGTRGQELPCQGQLEDLARVVVARPSGGKVSSREITSGRESPRIGVGFFTQQQNQQGKLIRVLVNVTAPMLDTRLPRMISAEAQHFSKESPGVVILDVPPMGGRIKDCIPLVQAAFSPRRNTRVSAVLLAERVLSTSGVVQSTIELITNPYAVHKLPPSFVDASGGSKPLHQSGKHIPRG